MGKQAPVRNSASSVDRLFTCRLRWPMDKDRKRVQELIEDDIVTVSPVPLAGIRGMVTMVDGTMYIVSESGWLFTPEEFTKAAGLPFDKYVASAAMAAVSGYDAAIALSGRVPRVFEISYTEPEDAFSMRQKTIRSHDTWSALDYASRVLNARGCTVVFVTEVTSDA